MRNPVKNILLLACALAMLSVAGRTRGADEEPAKPMPLNDAYVCIARDGVMVMEADFKRAKFHALPALVDLKSCSQAPQIFENDDHTAFLFYLAADRFWSCHVDRSGWLVGETSEFVPRTLERVDATTFRATYKRVLSEDDPDAQTMILAETWLGTIDARRVNWKLREAVKEPWAGRFGGKMSRSGRSCGGTRPEWEDLIYSQQGNTHCVLQHNTYDERRRRFLVKTCENAEGAQNWTTHDCEPFETEETWREGVIHNFAWDGQKTESLDVLILAVTSVEKKVEKEEKYFQWLRYENAGQKRSQLFDKEWQGRALLKLLKPVVK